MLKSHDDHDEQGTPSFFTFGSSFRRVAREDLYRCSFFESHLCSIAGLQSLAHANDNQTRVISFLAYASCIYKNEMRQGGSSCSIGREEGRTHLKTYPSIEWPISERTRLIVCGLTRSACSKIAATHGILKKHMAT